MDGLNPQHMWDMLTDLSENDPEQYAKFMKETMASAAPPSAARPEPGYVVKLRTPRRERGELGHDQRLARGAPPAVARR